MKYGLLFGLLLCLGSLLAQPTFPVNGTLDKSDNHFLLYNGTIHQTSESTVDKGYLEIKDGKVVSSGPGKKRVKGAVEIDLKGKHIYPSFIDLFSNYGLKPAPKQKGDHSGRPQLESKTPGAFAWNQAIRAEYQAADHLAQDAKSRSAYLAQGFGAVLSHQMDGIARGTGALTTLGAKKENENLLLPKAANFLSLSKGTSKQSYPSSLMGSIALLRQTYLDASWYKDHGDHRERNLSIEAFNDQQPLPQIFDAGDYRNQLRADRIGDEFGASYIIKGYGNEYHRMAEIQEMASPVIVPLHFPKAIDATDPYETMLVSINELKAWEMAPANAAILDQHGVTFVFTAWGLKDKKAFLPNLRKAVKYGLDKQTAIRALTEIPAELIHAEDRLGTLEDGRIANFLVVSKELFEDDAKIYENWVQGERFTVNEELLFDVRGKYDLKIGDKMFALEVKGDQKKPKGQVMIDTQKVVVSVKVDRKLISLSFNPQDTAQPGSYRLSGQIYFDSGIWEGSGIGADGSWTSWSAVRNDKHQDEKKGTEEPDSLVLPRAWFPNVAYGKDSLPEARTILIKNATVWTNEEEGVVENYNVLIRDGKIAEVGPNILDVRDRNALIIDAAGKHVTCGIIDEHSHIAISGGANESGQAIAAEVRIGDVINPDDINIYRQLAGGVTAAQLLHGSANPVGGQSALVKLKWGRSSEEMKIDNAPGFIKFALGENVKQSNWGDQNTIRFPQTRMGVEQVYYDGFIKAKEYGKTWSAYNALQSKKKHKDAIPPRRDLELETLLEIVESKRFITCHSYVQSEINMLMHVADSMGFTLNTFTHILEGYKVADKMAKHGAGASTFSDWWAYKYEVKDAIPYNAALLNEMGIVTAINSDDAEMARRLNQEAAKAVKYGSVSEEDAWKMVTLNPAKLLHLEDRMGSLQAGKDADVVIWSGSPLSVYSKVEKTIIDGVVYYDSEEDMAMTKRNRAERERILSAMMAAKQKGAPTRPAKRSTNGGYNCFKAFSEE